MYITLIIKSKDLFIIFNLLFQVELQGLLPKVRKGEQDCSEISTSLNKFISNECSIESIKTFLKSLDEAYLNDLLRLNKLKVTALNSDLRSLFRDKPDSIFLMFFFSYDLKKSDEIVWNDMYDHFLN